MCIDVELLSAYLDGELEPLVSASVEAHLASCPACRKRLEELREVDQLVKATAVPTGDLDSKRGEILSYLEEKHFSGRKLPFLSRRLSVSFGALGGVAAALFLAVGALSLSGNGDEMSEDILPAYPAKADPSNLVYVSDRISLDNYSLDEILDYLDSKGYEVELSVKDPGTLDTR